MNQRRLGRTCLRAPEIRLDAPGEVSREIRCRAG